MSMNVATNARIRKLAGAVVLLTALFLACAVGILTVNLVSLMESDAPVADQALIELAGETKTKQAVPQRQVQEKAGHDFLYKALLTVAFVVALAVIAPLVCAICLFVLLRRHSQQFGPLIRVEYASLPPVVLGPFTASSLGVTMPAQEVASAAAESTAQRVELGPTFDDERQLKEGLVKRQEAGVLQHLFEENLLLQEQIDLAKEAEQEPAAAA